MVSAVRPTLGPISGVVAIDNLYKTKSLPEVIDNGGVIARRIIELSDRDEDMGAMLVRSMICRQQDEVGDGTATAAVLFQAIYDAGLRSLAAGGNAARIRHYLEQMLPFLLETLGAMTFHVEGQSHLTGIAQSLCHDPEMAAMLGEIFDIVGPYGQLDIRKSHGRGLKREYVEGIYYNTGLFSREMMEGQDGAARTEYQNPSVLICDFEIDEPRDLFPVLKTAVDANIPALVIVIRRMSERAMSIIVANSRIDKLKLMAIKLPGLNPEDRMAALEDLSTLTGAVPLIHAAGDTLELVRPHHFGQARRIWAGARSFGIIGGRGSPRKLREHLASLEGAFQHSDDIERRKRIQERIGRLMGGSATLWIGGSTEPEIDVRKSLAERASATLRSAVRDGVVPGGGVALMICRTELERKYKVASDPDERAAYRILCEALNAPARVIFENAGLDPGEVMAKLAFEKRGLGFDVVGEQVVNVVEVGILDSAWVLKTALRSAVSTAALALTVDTLVHQRKPEIVSKPV